MDPEANLAGQQRLLDRCVPLRRDGKFLVRTPLNKYDKDRLRELMTALDEWIGNGGFLPNRMADDPTFRDWHNRRARKALTSRAAASPKQLFGGQH